MNEKEQKKAAKEFAAAWKGKGDEMQDTQRFWIGFLQKVLGVSNADEYILFEKKVKYNGNTTYIDAYIPDTRVLIEQKSIGVDLDKKEKRHGEMLTPFEQAVQYSQKSKFSEKARYIIVSNFETFRIYDLDKEGFESSYEEIKLCDLEKECHIFSFIIDKDTQMIHREMEISLKAGELVGKIYEALLKNYNEQDREDPETLKSLNILCVRIVFCLYAEDAGIFGKHEMFGRYLSKFTAASEVRNKLIELFNVLNTKTEERDPYMEEELKAFPYVNGGLFAKKEIKIPRFNEEIVDLLINKASAGFDWSEISPTIFGAVFESTLNPETRRSGGMHYTSIENIHKVIDPLFLNDLKDELAEILEGKQINVRENRLIQFRKKLASLTFLDPACGSGNFLTETYISLRRLENEALKKEIEIKHDAGQMLFNGAGYFNPIKVGIGQFYGIEINDFAVTVAKAALWIAESQMLHETEKIVDTNLDFLPLKSYANIVEGNSLRINWESVVPKDKLSYIMGNPPFVGDAYQTSEQKKDLCSVVESNAKNIDYVSGWYYIAAKMIESTSIKVSFVSTNSICQGEQVAIVWKPLYERYRIHIDYAYTTFKWDSEAVSKAKVHCIIVGFSSCINNQNKMIYSSDQKQIVDNINFYLINAPVVFLEKRSQPLCQVTEIVRGCSPNDDGNLLMTTEEYYDYIKREPYGKKFIRPFMMGKDFIQRKSRYCFWLKDANPTEIKQCPLLLKRINAVCDFRLKSKRTKTLELASTPTLFEDMRISETRYIAIPKVSSESRKYIPIDYLDEIIIPGDKLFFMKNASLYDFGIITSNVHNSWMRVTCGRLKSDYSYSNTIVYNNFPWCRPTEKQKEQIEQTAQAILDARALYPDSSLADLYDKNIMPIELQKAHKANDKAVMAAYGFKFDSDDESRIVSELMKMYQRLTENQ